MSGNPTQPRAEQRSKPLAFALAGFAVLTAGLLVVVFSQLPPSAQPWNLSVIGALALFATSRLGLLRGLVFVALAIAFKDAAIYFIHGWEPYPLSWVYFSGYALIGWAFLRRSESPVRIGGAALGASIAFFLVSNLISWLEQSLPYGYSLGGLLDCYSAAIPFYRGTLVGDMIFTGVLFGAHALLSRAYFPAERVETETGERGK